MTARHPGRQPLRPWVRGRRALLPDPVALACSIVAASVFLLHGFQEALQRDVALYAYAAQRVLDGLPPYVGVVNRAGPLAHFGPVPGALVARVLGIDQLLGMRVLFMLVSIVTVVYVYLLGRDLLGSRHVGIVAAMGFMSFQGFIVYSTAGPREKTLMLLFLVVALHATTRQRWIVAGMAISLATLTWQPALIALVGVTLLALRHESPVRWGPILKIVAGGLVPLVGILVYYAANGSLEDFYLGFVMLNAKYTSGNRLGISAGSWRIVTRGYGPSTVILLIGLACWVTASFTHGIAALRRRDNVARKVLCLSVSGWLLLIWTISDFDGWPDLFPILPFCALGLGMGASYLSSRMTLRTVSAAIAMFTVAVISLAAYGSLTSRNGRLSRQEEATAAVLSGLPAHVQVMSVQAPQPLVLSKRPSAIRHQMFVNGLDRYVNDVWPGGLDGLASWTDREDIGIIAIQSSFEPRRIHLDRLLKRDYVSRRAPGWKWYVHYSLVD